MIPFGWLPGHWGLRGKTRERARAEYELKGERLEQRLIEIDQGDDPDALALHMLEWQKKHGKISDYDYDVDRAKLIHKADERARDLAILDADLAHGKIEQTVFDRRRADLLDEPWVSIPNVSWDPVNASKTFFELDYNEAFLRYLQTNGYQGTEDEIINRWLNDVCVSIAGEMDLATDLTQHRRDLGNGLTEHT